VLLSGIVRQGGAVISITAGVRTAPGLGVMLMRCTRWARHGMNGVGE